MKRQDTKRDTSSKLRNEFARRLLRASAGAAALMLGTSLAHAQSGQWTFEGTPYLWGAAMKGDVQAGSLPRTTTDMSFSDVLDVLDFGLMGTFEARKGRWGFFTDAMYMKVSDSATVSRAGAGPLGATLSATANVKMKQTMLAAAVMYRAIEGASPVDVLAGARYNKLDVEATADFTLLALAASRTRTADKDWVDPYIGVRFQLPIASRWNFIGYADVGGFGVGADTTYQLAAGVNYEYSKSTTIKFGYRYLKVDYDKSGFVYDMKNDGLYIGVGMKF